MFLEYLFTDLTFFVIALMLLAICSLVINHGDKTVSKPQIKYLTHTRLLSKRALESRQHERSTSAVRLIGGSTN